MAELYVTYFLKKLANLNIQEADVLSDRRNQLETMERNLEKIQKFLKDAEAKQGDESVRNWLRDVRDITQKAEDVIDTFISKVAPLMITLQSRKKSIYPAFFEEWIACFKVYRAHHKFVDETTRIVIEIRRVSEEASTYGINYDGVDSVIETLRWRDPITTSYEEQDVVGLEEDVSNFVARFGEPDTHASVISIVGMSNSGKTTLAREIYINNVVKFQFNCRVWVHVPKNYTKRALFLAIATQILGDEGSLYDEISTQDLEVMLSDVLRETKYLIVLDNLWENQVWDEIRAALPCGSDGSRILITTCNMKVALYIDPTIRPHELRLLNGKESWELFYNKLFNTESSTTNLELVELEKFVTDIVASCEGLPLSHVEIGGLLFEESLTDQLELPNSENIYPHPHQKLCSQMLGLSFHHLQTHLKWCFLYFGIFPVHYEIPARKLLRLWIAEGFIHPSDERTQEEVAEEYLEQLNRRTLIQAVRRSDGRIQTCHVHPLVQEFAVAESMRNNFLHFIYPQMDLASPIEEHLVKSRRLGIYCSTKGYIPQIRPRSHLRTVLLFGNRMGCTLETKKLEYSVRGLKLVRVLDLEGVQLLKVPDVIGKLIHLRYLGLKQTGLRSVPSILGNLYNLQVLDLKCNSIKELPRTICNLTRLQILDIRSNFITKIPSEISQMEGLTHLYMDKEVVSGELQIDWLRNIEIISVVHAGDWIEEALGKLRNLRKLRIYGGFHVEFNVDIWEFISNLDQLRSLELVVSKLIPVPTQLPFLPLFRMHKLHLSGQLTRPLNVQDFPPNLTHLSLSWSYLEQDPIAVLEKLNLRILVLQMQAYVGKQLVFSRNGFRQLKFLKLKSLNELQECKVEQGAMPALTWLCISRCVQLKGLPEGLQYLNALQKLELLWMLPSFQARLRQDEGYDWYKIQNIPSVFISGTPIVGSET